MNSTVTFYKVQFDKDINAYVDSIETYLTTVSHDAISTFQYIRHDLNISIKINKSQEYTDSYDYNYCSIQNGSDSKFYYFIDKITQIAENTLLLDLSMDTINSLGQGVSDACNPRNFASDTEIFREHRERYVKPATWNPNVGGPVNRLIDKSDEGLYPNLTVKTTDSVIDDNEATADSWYLIYVSGSGDIKAALTTDKGYDYVKFDHRIVCYVEDNTEVTIFQGDETPTERIATYYYLSSIANKDRIIYNGKQYKLEVRVGDTVQVNDSVKTIKTIYQYFNNNKTVVKVIYTDNDTDDVANLINTENDGEFVLRKGRNECISVILESYPDSTYSQGRYAYTHVIAQVFNDAGTVASMGVTYRLFAVPPISTIDRTQSNIYKIISLPYCPIAYGKWTITSGGETYTALHFYGDWRITGTTETLLSPFPYTDIITTSEVKPMLKTFNNRLLRNLSLDFTLKTFNPISTSDLHQLSNESKIYNSNFWMLKFAYDSDSIVVKPELIHNSLLTPHEVVVPLRYRISNELNSVFGCKLEWETSPLADEYHDEQDYGRFLLINRNNEYPVFTDEYLNYMRNGYNYDIKANKLQVKAQIENAMMATVGGAIGGAKVGAAGGAYGAIAGAVIGGGVAAIRSADSISNTIASQNNAINKNLANLQAQTMSVSGTEDLSMLNWYNKNKLRVFAYKPTDNVQQHIYDYLRLYGYSYNMFEKPEVDSRVWYNFIQCNPRIDYEGSSKYKFAWTKDLSDKYNQGVTVFHNVNNNYDFDRKYENYEKWLIEGVTNE